MRHVPVYDPQPPSPSSRGGLEAPAPAARDLRRDGDPRARGGSRRDGPRQAGRDARLDSAASAHPHPTARSATATYVHPERARRSGWRSAPLRSRSGWATPRRTRCTSPSTGRHARACCSTSTAAACCGSATPHPPAHREPHEDDDRAAMVRDLLAQGEGCWSPKQAVTVRLEGRRAAARQARRLGDDALRPAAALRQRRRGGARPARRRAASARSWTRMNAEAARLGMGCTRYTSPSGYVNASATTPARPTSPSSPTSISSSRCSRRSCAPEGGAPVPDQGGESCTSTTTTPCCVYGYPGATGLKTGYTERPATVSSAPPSATECAWAWCCCTPPNCDPGQHLLDRGFEDAYAKQPSRAAGPAGR